jgi:hypothetical protein
MLPERPQQLNGLVVEQAGHETLLYHATSQVEDDASQGGAIHALNPTARLIWDLCDGTHTVSEIESALRTAFEVPADQDLLNDIRRTLEVFLRKGLLQA